MTNTLPHDWSLHGHNEPSPLLAGVLPRQGVHYLRATDRPSRAALVADFAEAVASDVATCGLSEPDENGARASLAGFFGRPTGQRSGVAILASFRDADALSRAVLANALARGVRQSLPVAVTALHDTHAHFLEVPARLHALRQWMNERGVDLGLVIVDSNVSAGTMRTLEIVADSANCAVLVVGDEASSSMIAEADGGVFTAFNPAQGKPWAAEFDFLKVYIDGTGTLVLRPGKPVEPRPIYRAAAPAAPVAREEKAELPIVRRAALLICRGEVPAETSARWRAAGYELPRDGVDALPKADAEGLTEVVIAGDGDQRMSDLEWSANRIRQHAAARGVNHLVRIRIVEDGGKLLAAA